MNILNLIFLSLFFIPYSIYAHLPLGKATAIAKDLAILQKQESDEYLRSYSAAEFKKLFAGDKFVKIIPSRYTSHHQAPLEKDHYATYFTDILRIQHFASLGNEVVTLRVPDICADGRTNIIEWKSFQYQANCIEINHDDQVDSLDFFSFYFSQKIRDINFQTADLRNTNLKNSQLNEIGGKRVDLQDCNFWNANLEHVNFKGALIHGADFSATTLENANFENCDIDLAYFDSCGHIIISGLRHRLPVTPCESDSDSDSDSVK